MTMSSHNLKFPFKICDLNPDLNNELLKYFQGERTGFVQVGPEKYFFPYKYKMEAEKYYNFEARSDDVWIMTVPRSGTTWTQELVWLLANNLDFATANKRLLGERFPFFEFPLFMHAEVKTELMKENANMPENLKLIEFLSTPGYETLSQIPSSCRRFIKTHFPFSLLPPSVMAKNCKIIYVSRNPKDVAISFYHLNRLFRTQGYIGDFRRYWSYFESGLNPWLPYGSHLKEALAHRNFKNVLFLKYEQMIADLKGTILKVADFLNTQINDFEIKQLETHLNINNFRHNPQVNGHELTAIGVLKSDLPGFIRKGGVNGERPTEFGQNNDLLERANKWIEANKIVIT